MANENDDIRSPWRFAYDAPPEGSTESDIERRDDEIALWCDAHPTASAADVAAMLRRLPRS